MFKIKYSTKTGFVYLDTIGFSSAEDFTYTREGNIFSITRKNSNIPESVRIPFSQIEGYKDDTKISFNSEADLEVYLQDIFTQKNILESLDKIYTPTVSFNTFNIGDRGVNETFVVSFKGVFLDFISSVSINDNQSISILNKKYDVIDVEILTNSTLQQNTITFTYPTGTKVFTFETKNIESIIPNINTTGESLWRQPSPLPSNNEVTLSQGRFQSEQNNGEGWNNHAYYGNFTGTFTKISHEFITRNSTNAYCYINFSDQINAATNNIPRIYISNGSTLQYYNTSGSFGGSTSLQENDIITVDFTSTTMQVSINGEQVYTHSGNYSRAMQNSYVNFVSYRFSILEDIITRKFN